MKSTIRKKKSNGSRQNHSAAENLIAAKLWRLSKKKNKNSTIPVFGTGTGGSGKSSL
jgi:hypothetical protein